MSQKLTHKQRKYLRGLGHALSPVVMVGQQGLTAAVMAEIDAALTHHELIKVKLRGDRDERAGWIEAIGQAARATLVNQIGQTVCLYRRNSDEPKIELPHAPTGGPRRS